MLKRSLFFAVVASLVGSVPFNLATAQEKKEDKEKKTQAVEFGDDLKAQAPADWKMQKSERPFRLFELVLPGKEKDSDGVLIVMHFGKGGGGDLDSNLRRWYGMVEQPEGKSTEKAAKKEEIKSDAAKITWLDMSGTYLDRPAPQSPQVTKRPNYRVFAAMIDGGKEGPYWIRAYGPAETMQKHRDGFEQFLKSIKK